MPEEIEYDAPIAVWVAAATLHRKQGDDGPFKTRQIKEMVIRQGICDVEDNTVKSNICTHCVANSPSSSPNSSKQCKLFRVGRGLYRLWRKGDRIHPDRKGGLGVPGLHELPPEYKRLLEWYDNVYCNKKRA